MCFIIGRTSSYTHDAVKMRRSDNLLWMFFFESVYKKSVNKNTSMTFSSLQLRHVVLFWNQFLQLLTQTLQITLNELQKGTNKDTQPKHKIKGKHMTSDRSLYWKTIQSLVWNLNVLLIILCKFKNPRIPPLLKTTRK